MSDDEVERMRDALLSMRRVLGLYDWATPEQVAFHVECTHEDMKRLHREKVDLYVQCDMVKRALQPFADEATEHGWTHDREDYDHCIEGLSLCTKQDFGEAARVLDECGREIKSWEAA